MKAKTVEFSVLTLRILWAGVVISILVHGIALFISERISHLTMPVALRESDYLTLFGQAQLVAGFFFYLTKGVNSDGIKEKAIGHIIAWVLFSGASLMGFGASYGSADGNGIFYAMNAALALVAMLITFPRQKKGAPKRPYS
jgi:hypothetical protein